MGIVFNHGNPMSVGDFHNPVHFTSNSCIVDGHNGFGSLRNHPLKESFIHVEGVYTAIDEPHSSPAHGKCTCRRNKGVARNNDFGLVVNSQGYSGSFKRTRTGCGELAGGAFMNVADNGFRPFGVSTVATDFSTLHGVRYVRQLLTFNT